MNLQLIHTGSIAFTLAHSGIFGKMLRPRILIIVFLTLGCLPFNSALAQRFEQDLALAQSGDSSAMLRLSESYRFGLGVEKSEDSSQVWISRAAAKGHTEAQYLEGVRLTQEIFTEKKFKEGVRLLSLAADKGNVAAMEKLYGLYITPPDENMPGSVFVKFQNPSKALYYALQAAERNSLAGLKGAATILVYGDKGVPKDSVKADSLMTRAASEFDDPESQLRLGQWYLDKRITGRTEPFQAWYWLDRAFNNPRSNLDTGTEADIERHRADQYIKRLHNASLQGAFFLKPEQGFVPLRRL